MDAADRFREVVGAPGSDVRLDEAALLHCRVRTAGRRCRRGVRASRRARRRVLGAVVRRSTRGAVRTARLLGRHRRLRRSSQLLPRRGARTPSRDPDLVVGRRDGSRAPARSRRQRHRHARPLPRAGSRRRRHLVRSLLRRRTPRRRRVPRPLRCALSRRARVAPERSHAHAARAPSSPACSRTSSKARSDATPARRSGCTSCISQSRACPDADRALLERNLTRVRAGWN